MQMTPNDVESSTRRYRDAAESVRYRAQREAKRVQRDLADAVDARVHDAKRTIRRGRHAVEDAFDDVEDVIRQMPVRMVLVGFGVGAALGLLAMALVGRRRPEI